MTQIIDDADHWAKRAMEARAIAASMIQEADRDTMLAVAESFDALAERARQRRASYLAKRYKRKNQAGTT